MGIPTAYQQPASHCHIAPFSLQSKHCSLATRKFCTAPSESPSRRVGEGPSACGCYHSSLPLISKVAAGVQQVSVADCHCRSYWGQDGAGSLFLKKGRHKHCFLGFFSLLFFPAQYYHSNNKPLLSPLFLMLWAIVTGSYLLVCALQALLPFHSNSGSTQLNYCCLHALANFNALLIIL